MKRGFLTVIAYSNGLWAAGLLLLIISAVHNLILPISKQELPDNQLILYILNIDNLDAFPFNHVLRFLYLLGSAFLVQYFSSQYRLIRVRSYFPFFFFCLFSATFLPFLPMNGVAFSSLFFSFSVIRLFKSFDSRNPHKSIFDAILLLSIASLFQPKLLFLIPVIWIMMSLFRVFSFKTFISSVLGFTMVYWVVVAFSFIFGNYQFLNTTVSELTDFKLFNINGIGLSELIYMIFLIILVVSSLIYFWPKQHLDKLLTRNYLNSIIFIWFSLLTLWMFSGNDLEFLIFLFNMTSIVVAYYFSLYDTIVSRILFISFLVISFFGYFTI